MNYQEQLKQMSNEELKSELLGIVDKAPHRDVRIIFNDMLAELLSRMEQPSPEHSNLNQQLFDYFQQEHDIMLLDGDYNEIKNILQPSQEHLKEALEEIANYPHAYNSQIDIQEIAKKALNQK